MIYAKMILCIWPGPCGGQLLDFFNSSIELYVLLNPYLCFITFLYLNVYVLDDISMSSESFMRIKHLFVMIHIRNKGEFGTIKHV